MSRTLSSIRRIRGTSKRHRLAQACDCPDSSAHRQSISADLVIGDIIEALTTRRRLLSFLILDAENREHTVEFERGLIEDVPLDRFVGQKVLFASRRHSTPATGSSDFPAWHYHSIVYVLEGDLRGRTFEYLNAGPWPTRPGR